MSTLHSVESGPAAAPTLLFLHGGGGAGWMWTPQVAALAADYHCLVPDLPEHGHSLAVRPFSIPLAVECLADLIRTRAHAGRAHVVGLSLGAQITVALLAHAPELVARAFISSALVRPLPFAGLYRADWLAALFRWAVAPLQSSRWYARLNMRYAAGVPAQYFPQFWDDFQRLTAESFAQVTAANLAFRRPAGLERAAAPALVVVGQREYAVMKASARDLAAALPNARGMVARVGRDAATAHNWNLTAPEIFTAALRAWLTDQPLPAELTPLE